MSDAADNADNTDNTGRLTAIRSGITWPQLLVVVLTSGIGGGGATTAANYFAPPEGVEALRADAEILASHSRAIAAMSGVQERNAQQIRELVDAFALHQGVLQHAGAEHRLKALEARIGVIDEVMKVLGRIEGRLDALASRRGGQ